MENINKEVTDDFGEINSKILNTKFDANYSSKFDNNEGDNLSMVRRIILFVIGFSYGGLLIASLVFSIMFSYLSDDAIKFYAIVEGASYFTIFAALIACCIVFKDQFKQELASYKSILKGLLIGIIAIVAELALSYAINAFFPSDLNENQVIANELTQAYPGLMVIISVIVGPFCEELTYRVGLFGALKKKNKILAYIVTILIFSFVHLSLTSGDILAELTALPIYMLIAFVLTFAYDKYGLFGSYSAHLTLNLVAALMTLWL